MKFFDQYTGIAVGKDGIWRSTNSGVNWVKTLSGQNMNSVSFPNSYVGYAVGDTGRIYKTVDGGLDWTSVSNPISYGLNTAFFVSPTVGYVAGKTWQIILTENGGNSWYVENDSYSETVNCIVMDNSNNGYIVGGTSNEVFAFTNNGGFNWNPTLYSGGNVLLSCTFIPPQISNFIAVGSNGRIRRTTNWGLNWFFSPSNISQQLNSIQFVDGFTGYIACNAGFILKSTDGATSWLIDGNPTNNNLRSINFINSSTGWAVGDSGIVLRTGIPVAAEQINISEPTEFRLYQNYPNPFNPQTNLRFDVSKEGFVTIILYDISGRKISKLLDTDLQKGEYKLRINMENFSSGIYFCEMLWGKTIHSPEFRTEQKLILLK